MKCVSLVALCCACVVAVKAADLSDLIVPSPEPATANPDDVMLRRPRRDLDERAKAAEAKDKAEAEAKAKAEAEAKKAAAEAQAKAEAEAKAKAEAEAKAKAEAEAKKAAAEAQAKAEAEAKAKAEAEAKAKAEAEAKKAAAEAKAKAEAEAKAKAEAEAKAKAEAEAKAKAEAEAKKAEVVEGKKRSKKEKHEGKAKVATARTGRDAVITSERTDYDRKEGIILFDRNVFVDDEQYQMHADRLFVFLDGTNDLKRIVAIGNVSITNESRTASCSRAVFTKAASKIVMYGDETSNARLEDPSQRGGMVEGKKITFWLDAEQVSVEGSSVNLPGGMLKGKDPKKLLEQTK